MFEKEAEERARKLAEEWIKEHSGLIGSYRYVKYDYDSMEQAFLAGAEFGYNKANEWHYVKDGDLPPLRKEVLWRVDEQLCLGELLETRIDFGEWELDSVLFNDYEIAWKEIVLPKEILVIH